MKEKWIVHVSTQNWEEEKDIIVHANDEQEAKRKAQSKMSSKFGIDYIQKVEDWRRDKEELKKKWGKG